MSRLVSFRFITSSARSGRRGGVVLFVRDERTAAWRVRKILAAIQMRHFGGLLAELSLRHGKQRTHLGKTSRLEMATKKFV